MSAADERIRVNKQKSWGAVPEAMVEDRRLGPTARLLAVWMCIRPPGWQIRRSHMLTTVGIGLDAWWRARHQLIEQRYLVVTPRRVAGRFAGADLEFFSEPQPAGPSMGTAQGFTEPGKSERGKSEPGKPRCLTTTGLPTQTTKTPPPPQTGGGGDFENDKGSQETEVRASSEMGLSDVLGSDLDRRCAGASQEQLQLLKALWKAGRASGKIKDEGAWLVRMALKATRGEITGQPPGAPAAPPDTVTLADELLALGLQSGSTIFCQATSKKWVIEQSGWTRNSAGQLVDPQTTRALIERVRSGELRVIQ